MGIVSSKYKSKTRTKTNLIMPRNSVRNQEPKTKFKISTNTHPGTLCEYKFHGTIVRGILALHCKV